jgi:adenosine deaminase
MNLQTLPKVELHLHLDCALSFEVVSQINPAINRSEWQQQFVAPVKCTNLADFLTRAVKGFQLMQTKEQLALVVQDLFRQLAAANIIYAEIRFAPLQHLEQGLTPVEVVQCTEEAVSAAISKTGIEARLLLCTLRHYSAAQSMATIKLAEQFAGSRVAGFDIAADEAGFPIDNHIAAFKYAKEKGIPCTAHAGEANGAASVWETLEYFGPTRIGHGVRSIEDPELVRHLVRNNIHLEVCPSCNVQINLYNTYKDHPIDRLYKAGVSLSVNTDAPTIVDIDLSREYGKLSATFGWSADDFYQCNVYALQAAFLPQQEKDRLMQKLKLGYGRG